MKWTAQRTWDGVLCVVCLTVVFALGSCVLLSETELMLRSNRVPLPLQGNFMVLPLETIQQKYKCEASRKTFLTLTELQIIPDSVTAGGKMNQIAFYAFCPSSAATRTDGSIVREVFFAGKQLFRDVTERYEFKPGLWAIGAFLTVPTDAKSGVYALDVTMTCQGQVTMRRKLFFVQDSPTS